ncbi:MAG: flavin reductase family protein [Candidatus Eisenbacteria bacterium]
MIKDPQDLGPRQLHGLLNRIVLPRPIAFVSSISSSGIANLAPFSYFTLGGLNPPAAVFCPVNDREGKPKDTLRNIAETKEYVIHIVTEDIASGMNETAAPVPPEVDEFELGGFTAVKSDLVAAPRALESPAALEMRLLQIVSPGSGPMAGNFVIGEILRIHLDESILNDDGHPELDQLRVIGKLGGDGYVRVRSGATFDMPRPM